MDCASKWNIETKQAGNRCQPSTRSAQVSGVKLKNLPSVHILFAFHLRVPLIVVVVIVVLFLLQYLLYPRICYWFSFFVFRTQLRREPSIRIRNQSTIEIVAHFNCFQRFFGLNLTLNVHSRPPFSWPNLSVFHLYSWKAFLWSAALGSVVHLSQVNELLMDWVSRNGSQHMVKEMKATNWGSKFDK